jgi:hypothetical protein
VKIPIGERAEHGVAERRVGLGARLASEQRERRERGDATPQVQTATLVIVGLVKM